MNKHHKTLLADIEKQKGRGSEHSAKDSYMLSGHFYYDISVPVRRMVVKEWLKNNPKLTNKEMIALVDSLYHGKSHEEKSVASRLLANRDLRATVSLKQLDEWLGELVGWAEIDGICQNTYTAEELLGKWKQWESFLRKLSKDKNINKRRASIVLLTGPITYSNDKRILALSFELIDKLKHEKPIIISKAISWLLRSGVKQHKKAIGEYVKKNSETLPKIAVRETVRKIETGRK